MNRHSDITSRLLAVIKNIFVISEVFIISDEQTYKRLCVHNTEQKKTLKNVMASMD